MENRISSADIKWVKSLSQKKFRDEQGLFVIEGEKIVSEALSCGFSPVRIFRREEIGAESMSRISALSSPSPVLAVLRQKDWGSVEDILKAKPDGLFLALDAVRDPGNLGTIIRTADWFGVDAIFCSQDTVELYNPKVVQSTMGAIFRKKVIYCDICDLCDRFTLNSGEVFGTFLDGDDIYKGTLHGSGLIVMGNEANGVSDAVAAKVNRKLLIPKFPGSVAESLNVAVATAVCLSEFRRQTPNQQ